MKKLRSAGKANHTKITNKVLTAIRNRADRETLRALQNNLVESYDCAVKRHDRYVQSSGLPLSHLGNISWWTELTQAHHMTLSTIDNLLSANPATAPSETARSTVSSASRRSSQHSSVSSTRARLLETERLQQEALLKLQQAEEEELVREEEEANFQQLESYKRQVEADREKQKLRNELEKQ